MAAPAEPENLRFHRFRFERGGVDDLPGDVLASLFGFTKKL
jgi:hypothetical protein